jgi:hypothetical protein
MQTWREFMLVLQSITRQIQWSNEESRRVWFGQDLLQADKGSFAVSSGARNLPLILDSK